LGCVPNDFPMRIRLPVMTSYSLTGVCWGSAFANPGSRNNER
jgi:hypothetical protein